MIDYNIVTIAVKASINFCACNKLDLSDCRSSHVQKWVGEKNAGSAIGGAPM